MHNPKTYIGKRPDNDKKDKTNSKEPIKLYDSSINNNKPKKNPQRQNELDRNISIKAKQMPNSKSSSKKVQKININRQNEKEDIKDNKNNEKKNEDYSEKIEKMLRDSYSTKSRSSHKKQKKNDFLKSSINLNAEFGQHIDNNKTNKKENDNNIMIPLNNLKKNDNNILNDIMNPLTNFLNENNNKIKNMLNPPKSISNRKMDNPHISKFEENAVNKNKNKEPIRINDFEKIIEKEKNNEKKNEKDSRKKVEKEPEKIFIRQNSSKKSTSQSMQKSNDEANNYKKRSSNKKHTYQSQIVFKDEKNTNPFLIERKKTLRNSSNSSSLKGSMKDSISRVSTFGRKSLISNSINNIIIPLLNRTKENNCFLNVIIQVLFHLREFKKELIEVNEDLSKNSKTIRELYNLLKSYGEEQIKNKDNKNQIEPILSVNDLRNYLNSIYKCYRPGEPGDPMETLGYILDLVHRIYNKKRNANIKIKDIEDCKCPSHQYFYLKLADIVSCPHCNSRKIQMFNKDCFMFDIFIKELTNKLHGKSYNSYKLKLFSKLKEFNETYNDENKARLPGCNCNKNLMSSYEKKLKLNGPSSPYLIINITWAEQFPSLLEILTTFGLIPISDNIENLFTFGEDLKTKINDIYYIKSVILYGIYHYVCILYIKDQKRWAVVDDKTIKYIKNYFDLIDFLLRNHLMPVGLIYSKDRNDEISETEIKFNTLNKDEYVKLYQFCKDVDVRRGLKVSDLIVSNGSFNENNQNYLNNNIFFRSIIDFGTDSKNNTPIGGKNNELFNPKTHVRPNNLKNIDNNGSNKNVNSFFENNNKSNEIINDISKRKMMGDFSDNNMKGGVLILSDSLNDNGNNEKTGKIKEDNDLLDFGKNYFGDNDN
jgi:hypothetical protein